MDGSKRSTRPVLCLAASSPAATCTRTPTPGRLVSATFSPSSQEPGARLRNGSTTMGPVAAAPDTALPGGASADERRNRTATTHLPTVAAAAAVVPRQQPVLLLPPQQRRRRRAALARRRHQQRRRRGRQLARRGALARRRALLRSPASVRLGPPPPGLPATRRCIRAAQRGPLLLCAPGLACRSNGQLGRGLRGAGSVRCCGWRGGQLPLLCWRRGARVAAAFRWRGAGSRVMACLRGGRLRRRLAVTHGWCRLRLLRCRRRRCGAAVRRREVRGRGAWAWRHGYWRGGRVLWGRRRRVLLDGDVDVRAGRHAHNGRAAGGAAASHPSVSSCRAGARRLTCCRSRAVLPLGQHVHLRGGQPALRCSGHRDAAD